MSVVPSCEDNGATVTWGHSPVATSYLLTATGRDGHVASCNTSVNNCTLAELHCGQPYSLSITASGDNCTSQPGTSSFRTGIDMIRHFRHFSLFHQINPLRINRTINTSTILYSLLIKCPDFTFLVSLNFVFSVERNSRG